MSKTIEADICVVGAGSGGLSVAAGVPLSAIGGSPSTAPGATAGAAGVDAQAAWADDDGILGQSEGEGLCEPPPSLHSSFCH